MSASGRGERDRALFDAIAARYASKDIAPASSFARRAQVLLAVEPVLARVGVVDSLVEVGCGVGAAARYLEGRYRRYIGIDQSAELVTAALALNRTNPQAGFIAGTVTSIELPAGFADLVLAVGALHHMQDPDAAMARMVGFLKPGGWVVAVEPQRGNPAIGLARWLRMRVDSSYSREQRFFGRRELSRLFTRHGLAEVAVVAEGILSTPLAQVVVPWQQLATFASRGAVAFDRRFARVLPVALGWLSWNLIARGRHG